MLDMVATVDAFVVGFVQAELAEEEARRRTGLTEEQWRARMAPYIRQLMGTGRYPFLERIVREAEDFPTSTRPSSAGSRWSSTGWPPASNAGDHRPPPRVRREPRAAGPAGGGPARPPRG
jgi:hypothetical protein